MGFYEKRSFAAIRCAGCHQYVWWRCENGHSWRARILSRTRGSGCPICNGKTAISGENDLLALFPNLAEEWNAERNGGLKPDNVTPYSNKKVWWRCALGYEWQAVIAAGVAENSAGPYCAGRRVLAGFNDLATLFPKLAAQWDDTLNGSLTPEWSYRAAISASGGGAVKDTFGKRSSTPGPEKQARMPGLCRKNKTKCEI